MSSSQEEAKIAFGDLLCSTVASKSGTFAVGGRANEAIPNFPAIPGLLVDNVARIDPDKPISLPLSEATGAKFFKKKRSPRSVAAANNYTEEAAVIPSSRIDLTNPLWPRATVLLADYALTEMGAVEEDDDPPISVTEKMLLMLPPSSYRLGTELYQTEEEDKNKKHFATLLIQLPSIFSQELAVKYGDTQLIFDMGGDRGMASKCYAQFEPHYVCHYKEGCKTRSVLDFGDVQGGGYRAVLVYSLEWEGDTNKIPRPLPALNDEELTIAMANMAGADRIFVVPLTSSYSAQELDKKGGLSALSDRDMAIVTAIETAGAKSSNWMNFRLGAFGRYISTISPINGRQIQTPDPIWFEESGFRADEDPMLEKIDWKIYAAGGHVVSKEPLWIDAMLEEDFDDSNGKICAVLLAYAKAPQQEMGTKKQKT